MEFKYQKVKTLNERKEEYQNVIRANPGKIAIICEKDPRSHIIDIEKSKYLPSVTSFIAILSAVFCALTIVRPLTLVA